MEKKFFNVSITKDFHAFLAEKYAKEFVDNPLELSDVLFLMPSRRAVGSLRDAFLQVFDLKPMILPQIKAISDFDEDELLLKIDDFSNVKTAVGKEERAFSLMKIIMAKEGVDLHQAYQLSLELAAFLDEAQNLGVDLSQLQEIVPDNFSSHVQEMFKFLKIITQNWPEILQEQNKTDVNERYNNVLEMALKNLNKTNQKVVICGISAPFFAIKNFLNAIENADIYFYGVDMVLNDEQWKNIGENHFSFENKEMLFSLGIDRKNIENIGFDEQKEKFISELMRPASSSENWQKIDKSLKSFFDNINIIEAQNLSQEALIASLLIKKHVDDGKTIALITPDRALSRRVCAELRRFDIDVDDSSGRPLSTTVLGSFMRLVLDNVINDDVVSFLSLIKHPYFIEKDFVKEYEKNVLRQKKNNEELINIAKDIKAKFAMPKKASLKEMMLSHIKLSQEFCNKLFIKEEGRVATKLFANILENCDLIDEVLIEEYQKYFDNILSNATVRTNYGAHPKIKVLGPIEAYFNKFDVAIIGSCNEGMWPMAVNANPWLSESMKKQLGLQTHAYKTGVFSSYFASILANKKLYITRAIKSGGSPQTKSRFLLKLEAIANLLDVKINKKEEYIYKKIADIINMPQEFVNIKPPEPKPPVFARPKEISASQVETWIKDPYAIYAKKILSLYVLDDLNQELQAKDFGTIIHKILEEFYKKYDTHFPLDAKEKMLEIGEAIFSSIGLSQERYIFWKSRLNKIVEWIVEVENQYSINIKKRNSEVMSSIKFGDFTLKAKADRIDILNDGSINILDYKTGVGKTRAQIDAGYAPQLPCEGLIFEDYYNTDVANLIYWELGKKQSVFTDDLNEVFLKTKEQICALIDLYDDENMPYYSCPDANNLPAFSDYEHLARLKEWSVKGDAGE